MLKKDRMPQYTGPFLHRLLATSSPSMLVVVAVAVAAVGIDEEL